MTLKVMVMLGKGHDKKQGLPTALDLRSIISSRIVGQKLISFHINSFQCECPLNLLQHLTFYLILTYIYSTN